MSNKQQTAVEWLSEKVLHREWELLTQEKKRKILEQAKAIDKQRIAKAFTDGKGQNFSFYDRTGEQYYEQTYGGGNQ
jgi:hypothetical protein